ncbi:hypothetical protein BDV38DRAFT_263142 [Aspergillus pseudotamarii]|uniref:Uncharacterized protein n=1 Tax=Aspergillus pseudotamarii TaxID=132259 RepID=A0A5N6SAX6_ASPPS|nr:uncharacterized protein BDV38DRAFT_263142 [Aspergillus pseudotamarii]KAE8131872.1 hypothetical protein BDV38DRAFT_263142 [Aspergillus pseudotamarii]
MDEDSCGSDDDDPVSFLFVSFFPFICFLHFILYYILLSLSLSLCLCVWGVSLFYPRGQHQL